MELKLATTADILKELGARDLHFAFVGLALRNRGRPDLHFACHGDSHREMLVLLRFLRRHIDRHHERN
jgi:hypothetical protein